MDFASLNKRGRNYVWLAAGLVLLIAVGALAWWLIAPTTSASNGYQTQKASLGNLSASISATGSVRSAQSASLVWNTSGRVETVTVAIGDSVRVDQVLAALAPSSVSHNVILAQADFVSARQNLDSLLQSDSEVAQAMKDLSDANQAVKTAQDKYDSLNRKRVSDELIKDTADQISKTEDQLKLLEWVYRRFYSRLVDTNANKLHMIVTLTNVRQNLASLKATYNWYTTKASETDLAIALANLNLAKARQEDAQRAFDRYKNGNNPDDISAARAKLTAAQATMNQAQLTAPFNGTITRADVQPGDRVNPGQSAFQVDDLSHLLIDLQISEVDINSVAVNQPVTITFEAIPDKTYNGVVSKVNLAAEAGQGAINFNVIITITDPDEQVKPGMSAAVTITVKQVKDTLIVPNQAIRMLSNGERAVYVLKDGQPVPVIVRLGAIADSKSQVVGGDLKEGDLIVLNPPAPTSSAPATPQQ